MSDIDRMDFRITLDLGPWFCAHCNDRITPESGWNPRLGTVGTAQGIYGVVINIFCGPCTLLAPVGFLRPLSQHNMEPARVAIIRSPGE